MCIQSFGEFSWIYSQNVDLRVYINKVAVHLRDCMIVCGGYGCKNIINNFIRRANDKAIVHIICYVANDTSRILAINCNTGRVVLTFIWNITLLLWTNVFSEDECNILFTTPKLLVDGLDNICHIDWLLRKYSHNNQDFMNELKFRLFRCKIAS